MATAIGILVGLLAGAGAVILFLRTRGSAPRDVVIKMPPRQQNKHLPRGLFAIPRPLLQRVSTRE